MPAWKIAFGELISECLAVFIIIVIGCSAACMFTLYDPSPYQTAYWGVCITWGLSVTIAIYVTGAVSGTHANPAVTLALALYRIFPGARYCLTALPRWWADFWAPVSSICSMAR
jgi:glycerol uptake facilitator protein